MSRTLFHVHTWHSYDSNLDPVEIVRFAANNGIQRLCITDHGTIQGSVDARRHAEAEAHSVECVTGSEIATDAGDVIGINLERDIEAGCWRDVVDEIHAQGGTAVLPHPYQSHPPHLVEAMGAACDVVEGVNLRCGRYENMHAKELASRLGKPSWLGCDVHLRRELAHGYMETAPHLQNPVFVIAEYARPYDIHRADIIKRKRAGAPTLKLRMLNSLRLLLTPFEIFEHSCTMQGFNDDAWQSLLDDAHGYGREWFFRMQHRQRFDAVRDVLSRAQPRKRRALEIGCGKGAFTALLISHGFAAVDALDADPLEVDRTVSFLRQRGMLSNATRVLVADAQKIPLDGTYDFILCSEVLEHVADPLAVLGEISRLCDARTTVCISMPNLLSVLWLNQFLRHAVLWAVTGRANPELARHFKYPFWRIDALVRRGGFRIRKRYARNVILGQPELVGLTFNRAPALLSRLTRVDRLLAGTPFLARLSGVYFLEAERRAACAVGRVSDHPTGRSRRRVGAVPPALDTGDGEPGDTGC